MRGGGWSKVSTGLVRIVLWLKFMVAYGVVSFKKKLPLHMKYSKYNTKLRTFYKMYVMRATILHIKETNNTQIIKYMTI